MKGYHTKRGSVICALLLLFFVSPIRASLNTQDQSQTVISTTVRFVQVRVMAEGAGGEPVKDIREDEIQVFDNRRRCTISNWAYEAGLVPPGHDRSSAHASSGQRGEYIVLVLDSINPRFEDRVVVRASIQKFLKNSQPGRPIGLYLLGQHAGWVHGFTLNPADLFAAVSAAIQEPDDPFDPSRPRETDSRYEMWLRLTPEERISGFNAKILDTIAALDKLAGAMGRLPGRKNLVWPTNGFPILLDDAIIDGSANRNPKAEEVSYRADVERLLDKINGSNTAIYTLDARGLQAAAPDRSVRSLGRTSQFTDPSYGDLGTLQEFAARTGGKALFGRNDLDEGIREAIEDSESGYWLGITVPAGATLGKHKIELRTTREGVKLRYRESYALEGSTSPGR